MAKYNKDMPEKLLKAMKQGHSFLGACGILGIGKTTGFAWAKRYKAFENAKDQGNMAGLKMLEQYAIAALGGIVPKQLQTIGSRKINVTMCIFLLKTRYHEIYGDKMKLESGDKNKPVEVKLNYKKPQKTKGKK
jgi:hypothetical protein